MTRLLRLTTFLVAIANLLATAAHAQTPSKTPAEKYQALLKEVKNWPDDLAKAQTAEEQKRTSQRLNSLPGRFLELAEEYPQDPIAVEALAQSVGLANGSSFPDVSTNSVGQRALSLLRINHLRSDKLGPVCQQVSFGFHKSYEDFLRAVLAASPHHEVQGLAGLSLAQFLKYRLDRLAILRDQDEPDMAERYDRVFGKDYLERLQREDHAAMLQEVETLLERTTQSYGAVQIPVTYYGSGGTIGETAAAALFQMQHLAVGKVAPEIEGQDQNGQRFKLSDYRGKVVLLDFWYRL